MTATAVAPESAPPVRPQRAGLPPHALAGAAGAALGGVLVWMTQRGLIDDAYITLAYAQNLARHLHWGLVPTLTANTATSPLNVMLLAVGTWLTGVTGSLHPVGGLGVLTVASCAAMGAWASQAARGLGISRLWALGVLAVVLVNPFLNSSVGLEVVPLSALLVGLLAQAVRGRPGAFGVVAGLVVLMRLDLGIFVAAVALLTPAVRRRLGTAVPIAAAVCLPWFALSWWFLGSAIPATFAIKTLQKFTGSTFADGLWTLWGSRSGSGVLLATVPAMIGVVAVLVLAVVGAVVAARRRRARRRGAGAPVLPPSPVPAVAALGLGGAAYYGAYCLLGVPPYQWYYVPSTVSLGVVAVLGLALLLRRAPRLVSRAAATVVAAGVVVTFVVVLGGTALPWKHPLLFGNWASAPQYLAAGEGVAAEVGSSPVAAPPEIGTVAYACRCTMVDYFSDPGRTLPLVQRRIAEAGPVTKALLQANFSRLDRSVQPVRVRRSLEWTSGTAPAGQPSWPTSSPAVGKGYLHLVPAS